MSVMDFVWLAVPFLLQYLPQVVTAGRCFEHNLFNDIIMILLSYDIKSYGNLFHCSINFLLNFEGYTHKKYNFSILSPIF